MDSLVAIDSNCMTYLVEAMSEGSKPSGDTSNEKIALLRIFIYHDKYLCISTTVRKEFDKIVDEAKRQSHHGVADILLLDIPTTDQNLIESLILEYNIYHPGEKNKKDCRILAEAELGGANIFLTYDQIFLNNLCNNTHKISMFKPSNYWHDLSIPHDISPIRSPSANNPLSLNKWWGW
jgi:hypothetical protein